MDILDMLPMKIVRPRTNHTQEVAVRYISDKSGTMMANSISNENIEHGDFILEEPISMISSNNIKLSSVKGVIDEQILKQCTKCGRVKDISKFGYRKVRGQRRDQAQCSKCRN